MPPCALRAQGWGEGVIAHLSGVVRRAGPDFVVLDVGGVGYLVMVATQSRRFANASLSRASGSNQEAGRAAARRPARASRAGLG